MRDVADIKIDPGQLNKRLTIQYDAGATPDAQGHVTPDWQSLASAPNVWAAIEPSNGRQSWFGEQIRNDTTHLVTIRYRSDVTDQLRFSLAGRILKILAMANPGERNILWRLQCRETLGG